MARPGKTGLDYFELDCQIDDKIKLIQAEFGLKGFALVVKLFQKIYGERGYYCEWDEDRLFLFMSENGVSSDNKNLISTIVDACIRRGIFSEDKFNDYGILTSSGIQRRYLNAVSRREFVEVRKEYLLISDTQKYNNVSINEVNVCRNSKNDNRNTQSRVEKSRVEKSMYSCAELSKSSTQQAENIFIYLPLNTGEEYPVPESYLQEYKSLYPAVEVQQQLRNIRGWLLSNPKKRKTKTGITRFINTWLQKEQDKGWARISQTDKLANRINEVDEW